jgi:hypothetical protein
MTHFFTYFNVADELDGGLTLDDLDRQAVAEARHASEEFDLPWPPDLSAAEDYLSFYRDTMRNRCEICGEAIKNHEEAAEMARPDDGDIGEHFPSVICHAQCGLNKGLEVA